MRRLPRSRAVIGVSLVTLTAGATAALAAGFTLTTQRLTTNGPSGGTGGYITLSPSGAIAGSTVRITGHGLPDGTITLPKYDGSALVISPPSPTVSSGTFTATFTVPSGTAPSTHPVQVTDGTQSPSATFTLTSLHTCTLSPTADTYIDEQLASADNGTAATLKVSPKTSQHQNALVQFGVTTSHCAETGTPVPATATITQALLKLVIPTSQGRPSSDTTNGAYRAGHAWSASTTWSGADATLRSPTSPTDARTVPSSGTTPASITWTVTTDAQAFFGGTATDNGWVIFNSLGTASGSLGVTYGSQENLTSTNRPTLQITYSS